MDFLNLLKKDKKEIIAKAKKTKGFLEILESEIYKAVSNNFKVEYKKVFYDLDGDKKITLRYIYKINNSEDILFQIVLIDEQEIKIYKNLAETKKSYLIKEISYLSFINFLKTKKFCFKN